ncbi:MAG: FAD-dependent monooxygenase [Lachnospiraceae bacterium]|nr:FAD-dependent monooxygenase [Lachnospiraceae bacterium]
MNVVLIINNDKKEKTGTKKRNYLVWGLVALCVVISALLIYFKGVPYYRYNSAVAMYAEESLRILVVEKRHILDETRLYDNVKCCGGILDDTAQKTLSRMKLALDEGVITTPQIFSVRAVDCVSRRQRRYARNYLNIDRPKFDRMLLQKAASRANVDIMEGTLCTDFTESKDSVAVALKTEEGAVEVVMTRYLVGADGAQSLVRRRLIKESGKKPLRDPAVYVSLQEWYDADRHLPYYMALFDRKVTDYYGWVIPKEGPNGPQILVGAAMPQKGLAKKDAHERFKQLKLDLTEMGMDLSKPVGRMGAVNLRPKAWGSVWTGEGRVFLCGEAAAIISPSSSEGISFALRSGVKLAQALNYLKKKNKNKEYSHAEMIRGRYLTALLPLKVSIALKTFKSPFMYHPLLRNLIFISGLTSIRDVDKPEERAR